MIKKDYNNFKHIIVFICCEEKGLFNCCFLLQYIFKAANFKDNFSPNFYLARYTIFLPWGSEETALGAQDTLYLITYSIKLNHRQLFIDHQSCCIILHIVALYCFIYFSLCGILRDFGPLGLVCSLIDCEIHLCKLEVIFCLNNFAFCFYYNGDLII